MIVLVLAIAVLLALYLSLMIHAVRGRGIKVPGVPEPLWVLALATFDPLIVGAYLLFVVFGVARRASWRKWVVYAACAFFVAVRVTPLVVPAAGSYPADSARPAALIPGVAMKLAVDYGSATSSLNSGSSWGSGWVVRDALIVGDGHPVSAAVVDQVARSLKAAGVREVRFVQSKAELPATPADMIVSVSVHDVFALDLIAGSYWSGRVQVSTGWRPFSHDTWTGAYDRFLDVGGASLAGSWNVASTRFGPVWGAARYGHVLSQLGGVGASVAKLLGNPYHGGRIEVRAAATQGSWREPGIEPMLRPYQPQPLVRGPGFLQDAKAIWKIELGEDPGAAVQALAKKFEEAGWQHVNASDVNRWWQLTAERDVDGNHQYVRVLPSMDRELGWGESRPLPSTYVVAYHDRFGKERLRALAETLLDSGEDDYLLGVLGESVPDARYQEWRQQVLFGNASVANLLNVARNDAKRQQQAEREALIQVAAWLANQSMLGAGDASDLREQVRSAAKSAKIELADRGEPATAELLASAGVPLLGERWLRVPYLASQDYREAAAGGAQQVRRFVGLDRDRRPVLLQVQLVRQESGEVQVDVGIAGGRRSVHAAAHLGDSVSSGGQDDRFEVREVDGHIEVRWLLQGE